VHSAAVALLLSFVTALLLTPLVREWAVKRGVVDEPGGRRVHVHVTPRLGGIGVIIGFFAPLALFAVLGTGAMAGFLGQPELVLGLVLGSVIVGGVGAVDDIRGLGPWAKLSAQATAACVAYAFGYRIDAINVPLIGDVDLGLLGPTVTVVWFLAITNAINLIDGLDGLAAGIAFFAAFSNFVIAFLNDSIVVVLLSASLGGALLGFLRYNFNPATIFLGDAGSMFLGFVLAATSIAGATTKSSTAIAILAPIIALGVPIIDTLLAMLRRALARQSIFAADRGHIHHRLLDLGITHRRVVLILYMSSILLAVAALGIAFGRSWHYGGALVLAGTVLFALVRSASTPQRGRPLATLSDRAAALRSLRERTDRVVSGLRVCTERGAVERCLAELGADKRLVSAVDLRRQDDSVSESDIRELVCPVRAGDHMEALVTTLSPALAPLVDEVQPLFRQVADACEGALRRSSAQEVCGDLAIAE
jgi:UDP-GlcNAc:undecaprenyl-phosphate/decaprenyl-phosphate GlcNAc-1-phosphate transferase